MAKIEIKELRKSYGDTHILKGINLEIKDNEFVVFVGPSGCGKSTLLRSIAGLEEINSGRLYVDEKDITDLAPAKRDLAMIFQSYALYPHMSVKKNMSFALKLAGENPNVIEAKVEDAAKTLELSHLLDRKPRELSGGQRQRVAIGRAIVRHPKVFLFDEPLSNLDAALRVQMRLELARLHRELNATMIYVTHDQVEAMTLADKVVVLNSGQIEQVGTPLELYHQPANQFVASFLGIPKMSFLNVEVLASTDQGVDVRLKTGKILSLPISDKNVVGGEAIMGIRPEHTSFSESVDATLSGHVEAAEHLGSDAYWYIKSEFGESLTVRSNGSLKLSHGQSVDLSFDLNHCHLFNKQGVAYSKNPPDLHN